MDGSWVTQDLLASLDTEIEARTTLIADDNHEFSSEHVQHKHTFTRSQLREAVEQLAVSFAHPYRLLVHLDFQNTMSDILSYLALLRAGHVVLLSSDTVARNYQPNATIQGTALVHLDTDGLPLGPSSTPAPQHDLHPDLVLLLSTSGSTGSAKLVRLSKDNILSNADGIIAGLGLLPTDRAATLLPLHYSFGLSILHTHLRVGASLVVGDFSCSDPALGERLSMHGVTNCGVVPHMLELAELSKCFDPVPSSLRLLYQAGGKLAHSTARRWSEYLGQAGTAFSIMYGQTEATARIAITPPRRTPIDPTVVGAPLPDTQLTVSPEGEIIVRGPGIMLGYAYSPQDLALGRMITELRTGDLGTFQDGLLRITGRSSDFLKIAGLRISLHQLEENIRDLGVRAAVAGDDEAIRILALRPCPVDVSAIIAATGLSASHVRVAFAADLPLLPNGKIHRTKVIQLVDASATSTQVLPRLAQLVGVPTHALDTTRSFVANGGSSLSHVAAAALLSKHHDLPPNWHHLPLNQLFQRQASWWSQLDMPVVLRVIAALTIVCNHAEILPFKGGAHALLLLAGFQLANYALSLDSTRARLTRIASTCWAVALPTSLVALVGATITGTYGWSNVFLIEWLWESPGSIWLFWFIETYLVAMLGLAGLSLLPGWSRYYRSNQFLGALILLAPFLLSRYLVGVFDPAHLRHGPPGAMWLVAAGVVLYHAQSTWQRSIILGIIAIASFGMFDSTIQYCYLLLAASCLLFVQQIRIPRFLVSPLSLIASSTLYIYILQFDILARIQDPYLAVVLSLAIGVGSWWVATNLVALLRSVRVRPSTRTLAEREAVLS